MIGRIARLALVLVLTAATPVALATPISVTANIPGGIFNDTLPYWYLQYANVAGGPLLQSAVITLRATMYFDTTGSTGRDFVVVSGGGTGLTSPVGGSPVVPDNSTVLTLVFSGFNPGETITWTIDVDGTPCDALGMYAGVECHDTDFVGTGVIPNTTRISLTFGGPGYVTTVLSGIYGNVIGSDNARVTIMGDVPRVPEPATFVLVGLGLASVAGWARHRRGRR
jgi:hypothetical protein